MMARQRPLLFSTTQYDALRQRIAQSGHFEPGQVERQAFPDGERYHRLVSDVFDRDVVLLSGTIDSDETLELFHLANAIVDYGAARLNVLLPYFGYATMERAVKPREAVKAKYNARLLSAIPAAAFGNRFFFVDLHAEGIPHYMEGGARTVHIYAKPVVLQAAKALAHEYVSQRPSPPPFVIASTDAGRAKWVESLAKDLGAPPAFAYKRRLNGEATETLGIGGAPVEGALVIMYDDMIRTGSSIKHAAQAYLEAGAEAVAVICTHGLFPGAALQALKQAQWRGQPLLWRIVCADTHPRALSLADGDFLVVKSIGSLLAQQLQPTCPLPPHS
jgi:ribose-phosphate pyrophosphokinase